MTDVTSDRRPPEGVSDPEVVIWLRYEGWKNQPYQRFIDELSPVTTTAVVNIDIAKTLYIR